MSTSGPDTILLDLFRTNQVRERLIVGRARGPRAPAGGLPVLRDDRRRGAAGRPPRFAARWRCRSRPCSSASAARAPRPRRADAEPGRPPLVPHQPDRRGPAAAREAGPRFRAYAEAVEAGSAASGSASYATGSPSCATRSSRRSARVSSATASTCGVCGNMSTGRDALERGSPTRARAPSRCRRASSGCTRRRRSAAASSRAEPPQRLAGEPGPRRVDHDHVRAARPGRAAPRATRRPRRRRTPRSRSRSGRRSRARSATDSSDDLDAPHRQRLARQRQADRPDPAVEVVDGLVAGQRRRTRPRARRAARPSRCWSAGTRSAGRGSAGRRAPPRSRPRPRAASSAGSSPRPASSLTAQWTERTSGKRAQHLDEARRGRSARPRAVTSCTSSLAGVAALADDEVAQVARCARPGRRPRAPRRAPSRARRRAPRCRGRSSASSARCRAPRPSGRPGGSRAPALAASA